MILQNIEDIKRKEKKESLLEVERDRFKDKCEEYGSNLKILQGKIQEDRGVNNQQIFEVEKQYKEVQFKLQDKAIECEHLTRQLKTMEEKNQNETSEYMKGLTDELKKLRETHQSLEGSNKGLQEKLGWMTKEYENLVQQL